MVKKVRLLNWPFVRRILIVLFSSIFIIGFVSIITNALYLYNLSDALKREKLNFDLNNEDTLIRNTVNTEIQEIHASKYAPINYHHYLDDQFPNTTISVPNKVLVFHSTPLKLGVIFTTFTSPSPTEHPSDANSMSALHSLVPYNNTLGMMGRLEPKFCSLVFADEKSELELSVKTNNRILPIPKKNVFGMPLLNRMFLQVIADQSAFFYCYTNADMLFPKLDLIKNLEILRGLIEKDLISKKVLVIGRRTNVEYNTKAMAYTDREIHDMARKGKMNQSDAQDYLFVTRNSFDWHLVPDFVVGRPAYDNWLVDFAYHRNFSIIDLTQTLIAIHQTGPDGTKASHSSARGLDRKWNYSLARGKVDHGSIDFAQYISSFRLSRRGVKYWTLRHKHQPNFYSEATYDTSV